MSTGCQSRQAGGRAMAAPSAPTPATGALRRPDAEPERLWCRHRKALLRVYLFGLMMALALSSLSSWRDRHCVLINTSASLPNWLFLVEVGRVPTRGDYIVFEMAQTPLVVSVFGSDPKPWVKQVLGVAGDRVSVAGRTVAINGQRVARAKELSRGGIVLHVAREQRIPARCYYVGTGHIDGFDSRYAEVGLICGHRVIGTARAFL